jgi:hypothetical protein
MQIDPEELRQHYASLSDEALRAIDRTELVDLARSCYDEELAQRERATRPKTERFATPSVRAAPLDRPNDEKESRSGLDVDAGPKPAWLEEAALVCSFAASPGDKSAGALADAISVLQDAGIPSHVVLQKIDPPSVTPQPQYEYRVMVPGGLNLQATSVLDKEIFNAEFEAAWRAIFEGLSDEQLLTVTKEALFGGLLDRVERVTRAYDEEVARRKISDAG